MDPTVVVGVAGLLTTLIAALVPLAVQQRRDSQNWLRDRRAETYLLLLRQVHLLRQRANYFELRMMVPGSEPTEDDPEIQEEQMQEFVARLRLYGSHDIKDSWQALEREWGFLVLKSIMVKGDAEKLVEYQDLRDSFMQHISEIEAAASQALISEKKRWWSNHGT